MADLPFSPEELALIQAAQQAGNPQIPASPASLAAQMPYARRSVLDRQSLPSPVAAQIAAAAAQPDAAQPDVTSGAPPIPAPNPNFGGAQPPPELAAADAASAARVDAGAPMFNGFTPVGRNGVAGIRTNDPSAIFGGIPPGPGMQTTAAESNAPPIQAATMPDLARQAQDIITRQLGPRPDWSRYINGAPNTREYDERANAMLNSLAQLAGVANNQGELNLRRIQTLSPGGTLARGIADIESTGVARQREAQLATDYHTFMADSNNGNTRADRQRAWNLTGAPTPAYMNSQTGQPGGTGGQGGPGSLSTTSTIEARLAGAHQSAGRLLGTTQGNNVSIPAAQSQAAIQHILNAMGSDASDPKVQAFLRDKFGVDAITSFMATQIGRSLPGGNQTAIGRVVFPQ